MTTSIEPTEEWTIEELLHWCLLQSQHKTITKRDEIMNAYQELFDIGKKEILELQSEVCKISNQQQASTKFVDNRDKIEENDNDEVMKSTNNDENIENVHPNIQDYAESKSATKTKDEVTEPTTIDIQIIAGPHNGSSFTLTPGLRKPCWVGRSTSKKFRDNGISLKNDDQVSTTHGKFHIHPASASNGKLVYTDTGSTNGTLYNNEELEDQVPLELVDGMLLVLGGSHLLIHLR